MKKRFVRMLVRSLFIFLLITLASVVLNFINTNYEGWAQASCWSEGCFCEGKRIGPIIQPVNTYSNLAYVLVGLFIVSLAEAEAPSVRWRMRKRLVSFVRNWAEPRPNLMRRHRVYPFIYGISVIMIGIGSLFYHASLTYVAEWWDLMGMYMWVSFMLLYNLARLKDWDSRTFSKAYLAANLVLGLEQALFPAVGRVVFGLLLTAGLGVEIVNLLTRRRRMQMKFLYASLFSFLLAFGIWILDNTGILCEPYSLLQGHSAWHLLTATATGLLYYYYRSEKETLPEDIALRRPPSQR